MRGTPATLVLALFLIAPASALSVRSVVDPAPLDVDDAELLRMLASSTIPDLTVPSLVPVADLPSMRALVEALALRTGAAVTPEDVAMFEDLDPRVDVPVRAMLSAIDQAWALRDQAFAGVSLDEQRAALERGAFENANVVTPGDQELLIQAAILLLDTAESIVVPALMQAAEDGAWPATEKADPLGILRLGGTGNDVELMNRVLQIDPRGDDLYRNNAGGTNAAALIIDPTQTRYHVAMSLDFAGNDHYNKTALTEAQGGGNTGIGILQDYAGDDLYYCGVRCQGGGSNGVGLLHDHEGNDRYYGGIQNKGFAESGAIGVLRDDSGSDLYVCSGGCGGYAFLYPSTGLLWDRAGSDTYNSRGSVGAFGWGDSSGRGWIADEGQGTDSYSTASFGAAGHGCNDCMWLSGSSTNLPNMERGGRGNDGSGGLAFLMTKQGSGLV